MHALQLHWYEVLAAVVLLIIWTALQLVLMKPPKPKQEAKSEPENPEPVDMDAYVKCQGQQIAETLRWKRFDFFDR